jgi:hypothetical protein
MMQLPGTDRVLDEVRRLHKRIAGARLYASDTAFLDSLGAALERTRDAVAVRRILRAAVTLRGNIFSESPLLCSLAQAQGPGSICPSFPRVGKREQCELVLGKPPQAFFNGALTPKEAAQALTDGYTDAIGWLLRETRSRGISCVARSAAVARWIAACTADAPRWQALLVPRGDHGAYYARTDEIEDADLVNGLRTGVEVAFRRSDERVAAIRRAEMQKASGPIAEGARLHDPPSWWKPIRCARLLLTKAALVAEGREVHHCVADYDYRVRDGSSVLVSLSVPKRDKRTGRVTILRSTVEYSGEGDTHRRTLLDPRRVQHRGSCNQVPHALLEKALRVCERRWFGRVLGFTTEVTPEMRAEHIRRQVMGRDPVLQPLRAYQRVAPVFDTFHFPRYPGGGVPLDSWSRLTAAGRGAQRR